jgi:hypothetical protein
VQKQGHSRTPSTPRPAHRLIREANLLSNLLSLLFCVLSEPARLSKPAMGQPLPTPGAYLPPANPSPTYAALRLPSLTPQPAFAPSPDFAARRYRRDSHRSSTALATNENERTSLPEKVQLQQVQPVLPPPLDPHVDDFVLPWNAASPSLTISASSTPSPLEPNPTTDLEDELMERVGPTALAVRRRAVVDDASFGPGDYGWGSFARRG